MQNVQKTQNISYLIENDERLMKKTFLIYLLEAFSTISKTATSFKVLSL